MLRTLAQAALVAAVTMAPGCGGSGSTAGSGQGAAPLAWADCGEGFECASLAVPRDWARPAGGDTIRLALIRLPASSAKIAHRGGSLLVNFGGPGAGGLVSLRKSGAQIRDATQGVFDIVSWDPRGVGESTPIACPEGNDAFYDADPDTAAGRATMAEAVALRARECVRRHGDYLGLLGTVQVVQDMDAIRAALGEASVTYLGQSYGTRVGAVYAQRFPQRVRAMVLDGSLPAVSTLTGIATDLAAAFEAALEEWLRRCSAEPACPFGSTDPLAAFDALVAKLRADPPRVPDTGGRRLTVEQFYQVVLAGLANYNGSTRLAQTFIGHYVASGDPAPLLQFADAVTGRLPDGGYGKNANEIFQFVNCLDWAERPTPGEIAPLIDRIRPRAPRLAAMAVTFVATNGTACPYPATPVPAPTDPTIPPLLVVGNRVDAETPLPWSVDLSAALARSVLLVWEGFGHTAFLTSPCVAELAGRYLVSLKLPPAGTRCPDLPVP